VIDDIRFDEVTGIRYVTVRQDASVDILNMDINEGKVFGKEMVETQLKPIIKHFFHTSNIIQFAMTKLKVTEEIEKTINEKN